MEVVFPIFLPHRRFVVSVGRLLDAIFGRRFSWVWVDTCCINKSSSAELQEAINSMFNWYKSASDCYVYMEDVNVGGLYPQILSEAPSDVPWGVLHLQIKRARWLTRGWTLQEFIASKSIVFYDCNWEFFGLCTECVV